MRAATQLEERKIIMGAKSKLFLLFPMLIANRVGLN